MNGTEQVHFESWEQIMLCMPIYFILTKSVAYNHNSSYGAKGLWTVLLLRKEEFWALGLLFTFWQLKFFQLLNHVAI